MYFLVGRVLGRRRRQGLFGPPGDAVGEAGEEVLEFGYCFDVCWPSLFRVWVCGCDCADARETGRYSRISSDLDLSLSLAIPSPATDSPRLLGLESLWQHNVPASSKLLLRHHVSGLQRYVHLPPTSQKDITSRETDIPLRSFALPEPNRGTIGAHTSTGDPVDHQPLHVRLRDESRAGVVVWCQFAETCVTAPSFMYSW